MKKILLLSLLAVAALFVIAACAPKEGGEEGALAGQAYGGAGGSSMEVKSCADTGTSVTYTKKNGLNETKIDECAAGNKRKDYSCSTTSSGSGKKKQSKTYFNTYTTPCGTGTTCQAGACVVAAVCGNNVKEGSEVCDGTDLGGAGCNTQTKDPSAMGTLKCYSDCTGFDTSLCAVKIQTENVTMEIAEINKTTTTVTPPAMEICDGLDNTGDGQVDEGCDDDNDGYCDGGMTNAFNYTTPPCPKGKSGWGSVTNQCCPYSGNDCNDNNVLISPQARATTTIGNTTEVSELACGNGIDDDCDGIIDNGCTTTTTVQTNQTSTTTNNTNKTNTS